MASYLDRAQAWVNKQFQSAPAAPAQQPATQPAAVVPPPPPPPPPPAVQSNPQGQGSAQRTATQSQGQGNNAQRQNAQGQQTQTASAVVPPPVQQPDPAQAQTTAASQQTGNGQQVVAPVAQATSNGGFRAGCRRYLLPVGCGLLVAIIMGCCVTVLVSGAAVAFVAQFVPAWQVGPVSIGYTTPTLAQPPATATPTVMPTATVTPTPPATATPVPAAPAVVPSVPVTSTSTLTTTTTVTATMPMTNTSGLAFDPNWTYIQLKEWILQGVDFEDQNDRFWAVSDWALANGLLHNTASSSEENCLGIFPEFSKWGSHDSCGISQASASLKGTWTLSVTEYDLLFKSRHDWGNTQSVVLWDTPAVRFGTDGDIVAVVTYPGGTPQTCAREFEVAPSMVVSLVNSTKGNHQITFGETSPGYDNECRPDATPTK